MRMRRVAGTIGTMLFVVHISAFALAQSRESSDSVEREIKNLEQERLNAYVHLDLASLDRIMSEDYTSIYADGQIVTKAQEMQGMKSATVAMLSSVTARIDNLSVRHDEAMSVLTGRLIVKGKIVWSEKNIVIDASFRYTATYVKQQDRWRIVTSQFTKIDDSAEK